MKIKKGIVVHNFEDSYIAYDTKNSLMHELNETGYILLNLLKKKKSEDEIVEYVSKHFEVKTVQAKRDFIQFIKILKSKDLIE